MAAGYMHNTQTATWSHAQPNILTVKLDGASIKRWPEHSTPMHMATCTAATVICRVTAVMPIVRPDIDNWVRDRAPKFVSQATFKNLNRWHRVFDADRRESIAFLLQYFLGLRLFLLLWATEVVCCPLGLRLLWKDRPRIVSRLRKKACESVSGAALSLCSRSCRRVFSSALFQAQLIFYWVLHIFLG